MAKKIYYLVIFFSLWLLATGGGEIWAQAQNKAQWRIIFERGEKVRGQRLELVKRVIESYAGCQVISPGNELTGLVINRRTYHDFTIIIREAKKTILVITADGVVNFDY